MRHDTEAIASNLFVNKSDSDISIDDGVGAG